MGLSKDVKWPMKRTLARGPRADARGYIGAWLFACGLDKSSGRIPGEVPQLGKPLQTINGFY